MCVIVTSIISFNRIINIKVNFKNILNNLWLIILLNLIIYYLQESNIYLNIIYPYPTHIMPPFKKKIKLKNTEKFSKEIFSLPIYPNLTKKTQMEIINSLKDALKLKK